MRGYTFDAPGVDLPQWLRRILITDDGATYIPAAVAGDERHIAMCAAFDGCSIALDAPRGQRRHVYLPTYWIAAEYPHLAEVCAAAEMKAAQIRTAEAANMSSKEAAR
jgi:hypothetical protein